MDLYNILKKFLKNILPSYRVSLRIEELLYKINYKIDLMDRKQEMLFWYGLHKDNETLLETKMRFFSELPKAEGKLRDHQLSLLKMIVEFDELCKKNQISYWLDCGNLLGSVRNSGFIPWDDDVDIGMTREDFRKLCNIIEQDSKYKIRYLYDYKKIYVMPKIFYTNNDFLFLDIIVYDEISCQNDNEVKYKWNERLLLQNKMSEELFYSLGLSAESTDFTELLSTDKENILKKICNKYSHKLTQTDACEKKNYLIICMEFPKDLVNDKRCFPKDTIFPLKSILFESVRLLGPNKSHEYLQRLYGDIYELPSDLGYQRHMKIEDID